MEVGEWSLIVDTHSLAQCEVKRRCPAVTPFCGDDAGTRKCLGCRDASDCSFPNQCGTSGSCELDLIFIASIGGGTSHLTHPSCAST